MRRAHLIWLAAITALAVIVAVQVVGASGDERELTARADVPTVAPGSDVLAGIVVVPQRQRGYDYRRAAFGDAWDDDNGAPLGHNGCDTRFLGGFGVLGETLQEVEITASPPGPGFKQGTLR